MLECEEISEILKLWVFRIICFYNYSFSGRSESNKLEKEILKDVEIFVDEEYILLEAIREMKMTHY